MWTEQGFQLHGTKVHPSVLAEGCDRGIETCIGAEAGDD